MVGAEIEAVEVSAAFAEEVLHFVMDFLQRAKGGFPAGHDGLVGDADREVTGFVDPTDGWGGIVF